MTGLSKRQNSASFIGTRNGEIVELVIVDDWIGFHNMKGLSRAIPKKWIIEILKIMGWK